MHGATCAVEILVPGGATIAAGRAMITWCVAVSEITFPRAVCVSASVRTRSKACQCLSTFQRRKLQATQANWIFKLDKRPQISMTDQWLQANLGKFARLSGQPCFVTSDIGHVGNL